MKNTLILLCLLLLATLGMGNKGCEGDDDDTPTEVDPDQFAEALKTTFESQRNTNAAIEAWVTVFEEPNFHPCMARDISDGVLLIAESWVDPIKEEATAPDGSIHLPGGPILVTRCMDMAGKPDPWPPLEPNPDVEAAIKASVPAAFSNVKLFITLKQPDQGQACIQAEIWKAILGDGDHALQATTTGLIIDAVNGVGETALPPFDVNYAGCGLELEGSTHIELSKGPTLPHTPPVE